MRRGHAAAALAVVATAVLTLTPAAGVMGSIALNPHPAYLDPTVGYFAVFANSHWVVSGDKARQFDGVPEPTTHGYTIAGNETPHYMWAQTCAAARQHLVFHRTVWLAGQPQTLQFIESPTGIPYWSEPLSRVQLIVNDKLLVDSRRSSVSDQLYGDTLPAAVFRPGKNDLEVVVTKRANPSSVKSCGVHSSTRLGIQFALVGQGFPVDLGVKPVPTTEKTQWIHIKPGGSVPFIYYFTVTNHGPSAAGSGQFAFRLQYGFMTLTTPVGVAEESPFTCKPVAANSSVNNGMVCTTDNWFEVDKPVKLTAYWKLTAPSDEPNTDVEQVSVDWGVAPLNEQRDDNYTNDTTGKLIYFCYPAATTNGCDKH